MLLMTPLRRARRAHGKRSVARPSATSTLLAALALGLSTSALTDDRRLDELRGAGEATDVPQAHERIDGLPNVDPSIAARAHALLDRAFG